MDPRPPDARNHMGWMSFTGEGWWRQGPVPFVGTPRRSHGYAFGAPPRVRGPGAANESHQTCAELP